MQRFQVEEGKRPQVSKYCITDSNQGHNTIVLSIPDYITSPEEFGKIVCELLNNQNKYIFPETLIK